MTTTLKEALNNYPVYRLKDLAKLVTNKSIPENKSELVNLLENYINQNLEKIWQDLDELQQAAVAEVVHSDGNDLDSVKFEAKYGGSPEWSIIEISEDRLRYTETPTKLWLYFFPTNRYDHNEIIPEDIKVKLKKFVPKPISLILKTLTELPPVWLRPNKERWIAISSEGVKKPEQKMREFAFETRLREKAAIQDLQAILRLISSGKITVSDKTKQPNSASLKVINPILADGDFYEEKEIGEIQSFAWCMLLQEAELVTGKKLQLTSNGTKALNQPPHQTIRQIWQKWLKNTFFDELKRINNIKGQTGAAGKSLTSKEKRRKVIIDALKICPVGEWIETKEFCRYFQAFGYDLTVSRKPDSFSLDDSSFIDLDIFDSTGYWQALEARYLLCFLFEYAATLGLLDVAYVYPGQAKVSWDDYWEKSFFSRYDGLIYFRLNDLGAYCLGLTKEYTPPIVEVSSEVTVLPNLEIVVIGEVLTASEQLILDLYAEKISDSVWKLTENQLLTAHASGHQLSEFEAFLLKLSGNSLPPTVQQLLADVNTKVSSLTKRGTGIIIDCADVALATLIANDSRTKQYCILAGEKSLVVPLELETKFRNGLQKLGYTLPNN